MPELLNEPNYLIRQGYNMFNLMSVKSTKKVVKDDSLTVAKVSPLGSNYYRKGDLTGTSKIEFCFSIAVRIMQQQDCDFVPVELVLAIADEFSLDLSTEKVTAKKRVMKHCNHDTLDIASIQDVTCTLYVQNDVQISTEAAFTQKNELRKDVTEVDKDFFNQLVPSLHCLEQLENVVYDFPIFDFTMKADSMFIAA